MSVINFEFFGLDAGPEIFYFGRKEFAFLYLDCDICMSWTSLSIDDMVDIFFDSVQVNDYIKINKKCFSLIFSGYDVKSLLKGRRDVC